MNRVRRLLITIGVIYVGLVALIAAFQRHLLFFPSRESEEVMSKIAKTLDFEPWRNATGEIVGWTRSPQPGVRAANKLVVFHGNAGFALHREDYARAFESVDAARQWQVWLFEYPGYGARVGNPGRDAFRRAARDSIAELRALDSRPLFLLGESLGAGVACDLAVEPANAVAGLVLVTPFARLTDVAQMHFPLLPARLIVRDRWDNASALTSFRGPTAVLVAGHDEVISMAQGDLLFDKAKAPKRRWFFPDAQHNDNEIQSAKWAGNVSAFLLDPAHAKR